MQQNTCAPLPPVAKVRSSVLRNDTAWNPFAPVRELHLKRWAEDSAEMHNCSIFGDSAAVFRDNAPDGHSITDTKFIDLGKKIVSNMAVLLFPLYRNSVIAL